MFSCLQTYSLQAYDHLSIYHTIYLPLCVWDLSCPCSYYFQTSYRGYNLQSLKTLCVVKLDLSYFLREEELKFHINVDLQVISKDYMTIRNFLFLPLQLFLVQFEQLASCQFDPLMYLFSNFSCSFLWNKFLQHQTRFSLLNSTASLIYGLANLMNFF